MTVTELGSDCSLRFLPYSYRQNCENHCLYTGDLVLELAVRINTMLAHILVPVLRPTNSIRSTFSFRSCEMIPSEAIASHARYCFFAMQNPVSPDRSQLIFNPQTKNSKPSLQKGTLLTNSLASSRVHILGRAKFLTRFPKSRIS